MTALTRQRASSVERWNYKEFTLASGNVAYKGGIACLDLSTGKVEPGHVESDLLVIGSFAENVDATSADKLVNVELGKEIEVRWYANHSGGDAVASTDIGKLCYVQDDQTVTITSTGRSVAGRVWAVSSTDGVAVEKLQAIPSPIATLESLPLVDVDPGAFVANDLVIGNNPNSGTVYDVPTTAANSTVTLPATAVEGTKIYFVADGTKNGHTVQYRDATGPTNLTTALTASKRHLVVCVHLDDKWYANAYVSP
jgi:hypothetical protein